MTTSPVELSEVIGGYVLERVLGRGGMGTVFLGRHHLLGRAAAVKVLDPELAGNEQLVSRFFHEAKIVNDVRHPNIVDVIDFVHTENPRRVAFIMEYLDGASLDRFLKEKGPLTVAQAVNVILQVLDGLAAVHAIGVIHRDLKPANLRFTQHALGDCSTIPIIKVLDFGIAKASEPVSGHKTQTGIVLGTPAYMAPEQVSGDMVSPASDVYAVGEILFELVGGRRLFSGTNTQVLRAKLAPEPPDIELPPELAYADELRAIVRSCVALDPVHRPSTEALIAALMDLRPRLNSAVPYDFSEPAKVTTLVPVATRGSVETPSPMNTLAAERSLMPGGSSSFGRTLLLITGTMLVAVAVVVLIVATRAEEAIVVRSLEDSTYVALPAAPPPPPALPPPQVAIQPDEPVDDQLEKIAKASRKKPRREPRHKARPPSPPPPPSSPPPVATTVENKYGRIKVTAWTTAGRQIPAKVKIDGRAVDRSAPFEIKARTGRRKIEIEAEGYPPKTQEIVVGEGETAVVDAVVDLR